MATYKQLTAQLEKLRKEVAIAQQKEIAAVIEEIKRKIVDYDLSAEELGFSVKRGRQARKATLPPQYRDPKTAETWSARRRPPGWLAGRNKEPFLTGAW